MWDRRHLVAGAAAAMVWPLQVSSTGAQAAAPAITALAVVAEGERIVAGFADGRLALAALGAAAAPAQPLSRHHGAVRALAALPAGWWVSAAADGAVWLWPAEGSDPKARLAGGAGVTTLTIVEAIGAVVAGGEDGRLRLFVGQGIIDNTPVVLTAHDGAVRGVAMAADPTRAVTAGDDGTVALHDLPRAQVIERVVRPVPILHLVQRFDGLLVAAASDGRLWRAAQPGGDWAPLAALNDAPVALALTSDGSLVVAASTTSVLLVDMEDGAQPRRIALEGAAATAIALSSDHGTLLVGRADGTLSAYDIASGGRRSAPTWPKGAGPRENEP